ncbi:hypothetical protein [Zooshikella sp. RANM57]|uniref:hypothetical protein n=1 Tax=Zooshikella sp. RANM57 TaxID=3425863 RepID=UPI003D6F7338
MNKHLVGIPLASLILTLSMSSIAEETIDTSFSNIENALMAPASDAEYKAAVKLKAMRSSTAQLSDAALNAARPPCYSALPGKTNQSLIMVPLPDNQVDLDAVCHVAINSTWHAGGVAKGHYYYQNCGQLDNKLYGGGYTSFVTEQYFEANRTKFSSCNATNAVVCCSPQFSN